MNLTLWIFIIRCSGPEWREWEWEDVRTCFFLLVVHDVFYSHVCFSVCARAGLCTEYFQSLHSCCWRTHFPHVSQALRWPVCAPLVCVYGNSLIGFSRCTHTSTHTHARNSLSHAHTHEPRDTCAFTALGGNRMFLYRIFIKNFIFIYF